MKDICKPPGFIDDEEIQSVAGGTQSNAPRDFSIFLFCRHCGRKTKMQMLSLHCAICETCRELTGMQINL